MKHRRVHPLTVWALPVFVVLVGACAKEKSLSSDHASKGHSTESEADAATGSTPSDSENVSNTADAAQPLPGTSLSIDVLGDTPTYVALATPSIVTGGQNALDWDLEFKGLSIFTNGGVSGSGSGAAFGPEDPLNFLFDTAPQVPFLRADMAGGTFLDWYAYSGEDHHLWSRHHIYGMRAGERYFKVEILSYYGDQAGAPVSALYQLRYAEVTQAGVGQTQVVKDLNASAGGAADDPTQPSGCLDLISGERLMLTPMEATQSSDWQLCFRRDTIGVNGGSGGPGNVEAVDLDQAKASSETIEQLEMLTADSELPRFEAVDFATLSDPSLNYLGDGVVSAFSAGWYHRKGAELEPVDATWFVRGADGLSTYLVLFSRIETLPAQNGYRIAMQIRPVK
ncbi:MAG TPA: hypothetical protein VHM70_00470 [Polyangiaceae bacterium]|nr:hypothetical protein [Polyangiaceae bacterium]